MTGLENLLTNSIVHRIGWALLHFLWQGAFAGMLLAGAMWFLRGRSANLRYTIACATLVLMLAMPAVTMSLVRPAVPEAAISEAPVAIAIAEDVAPIPAGGLVELVADGFPSDLSDAPAASAGPTQPWYEAAGELLRPAPPWIVCAWLVGVFGLSLWHLWGWMQVRRLRGVGSRPVSQAVQEVLLRLSGRLGLARAVRAMESAMVRVPMVVGWLRPVILLPASALTGLTTEQLEAILAHELAHIRRYDYLLNLLQTVAETLLFYHPAVWWVSRRIRLERENCCDDLAVGACGRPMTYARALAAVARLSLGRPRLAVAADGGRLLARVRRIVALRSEQPDRRAAWLAGVLVITFLAAAAVFVGVQMSCAPEEPAILTIADVEAAEEDLPVYDVPRLDGIVIDGDAADWGKGGFRVERMVRSKGPATRRKNFDARFRLGWNDRGLLVLVTVCDDIGFESENVSELWLKDCVELFLAPQRGAKDYWQVIFSPGVDRQYPQLRAFVYDRREDQELKKVIPAAITNRTKTADGYVLETLLPWDALAIRPQIGREIAFQIYVQDYDGFPDLNQRIWYPATNTSDFSDQMHRVRLAAEPSPPVVAASVLRTADAGRPGRILEFLAVDKPANQPLADVGLRVRVGESLRHTRTDENGRARIALPAEDPKVFYIRAVKKGYVGVWRWWRGRYPAEPIPTRYTMGFEPGIEIGGTVTDQQGRGIPGVRVHTWAGGRPGDSSRDQAFTAEHIVLTDAQGRWTRDSMPPDMRAVGVRLSHRDYIGVSGALRPSLAKLRNKSAVMVMKSGLSIEGTVTDAQGNPITAARVIQGTLGGSNIFEVQTDARGKFRFANARRGRGLLVVTATGYAPEMTEVLVKPEMEPVRFQLQPPRTLRGRVVDQQGNPVEGVYLNVTRWRGRSLLRWQGETDSDGHFFWKEAPADQVTFSVRRLGFPRGVSKVMKAGEKEYEIILPRPLTIRGRVLDAETGRPIEGFQVYYRVKRIGELLGGGQYLVAIPDALVPIVLRVEADGYEPASSREFQPAEGDQLWDFKLKPSKMDSSGTDDKPAPHGATTQPWRKALAQPHDVVSEVALRFLKAVRDNDLDTMKSLSAGSVQGWGPDRKTMQRAYHEGAQPIGWSVESLEKAGREIRNEVLARNPGIAEKVLETAIQGDFAATMSPPVKQGSSRYLVLVFIRTSQGWRFATIDNARGPLREKLPKHAKRIPANLNRIRDLATQPGAGKKPAKYDAKKARTLYESMYGLHPAFEKALEQEDVDTALTLLHLEIVQLRELQELVKGTGAETIFEAVVFMTEKVEAALAKKDMEQTRKLLEILNQMGPVLHESFEYALANGLPATPARKSKPQPSPTAKAEAISEIEAVTKRFYEAATNGDIDALRSLGSDKLLQLASSQSKKEYDWADVSEETREAVSGPIQVRQSILCGNDVAAVQLKFDGPIYIKGPQDSMVSGLQNRDLLFVLGKENDNWRVFWLTDCNPQISKDDLKKGALMAAQASARLDAELAAAREANLKTLRKLQTTKVSPGFENAEFKEVVQYLRDVTGTKMAVSYRALHESGVSLSTPVSLKLSKVSAEAALKKLLESLRASPPLGYVIRNGQVLISTRQAESPATFPATHGASTQPATTHGLTTIVPE